MSTKYEARNLSELKKLAKQKGINGYSGMNKDQIILLLRTKLRSRSRSRNPSSRVKAEGVLSSSPPSWNPKVPKPKKGATLEQLNVEQLRQKAKLKRCVGYRKMKRDDLINEIRKSCTETKKPQSLSSLREKVKKKGCKGYSMMNIEKLENELKGGCTKKMKVPNEEYKNLTVPDLRLKVKEHIQEFKGYSGMKRADLIEMLNRVSSV